jgi:hypothetical protein
MPDTERQVTFRRRRKEELPDCFAEAVLVVDELRRGGLIEAIASLFLLARRGGSLLGVELFILLLTMWASGKAGQRRVCEAGKWSGSALAGALGLSRWATQSVMSMALAAAPKEAVRKFVSWLLGVEALSLQEVIQAPSSLHYDTLGHAWLVGASDGRVVAFRQRALPEGPTLPEGRRRRAGVAAPGYTGRKRGEVQLHQTLLQQLGTGLYFDVQLSPGNGEHHAEVEAMAQRLAQVARTVGFPSSNVLLLLDGEAVGEPAFEAALRADLKLLTRWKDYALLQEPATVARLRNQASWSIVPDSGSGPRREATELGLWRLGLHGQTVATDEQGPLDLRLVVSRFQVSGPGRHGCGVRIGDWQYELYATLLDAAAWPAAELVTLYYARCGQENYFEQTDAESGKLRLISTHLPGQELAVATALFLSNWRFVKGLTAKKWKPSTPSDQVPRQVELVPSAEASQRLPVSQAAFVPHGVSLESTSAPASATRPVDHPPDLSRSYQPVASVTTRPQRQLYGVRLRQLLLASKDATLDRLPGWSWSPELGTFCCPAQRAPRLHEHYSCSETQERLRFRVPRSACRRCSQRPGCTNSTARNYAREFTMTVEIPPEFDTTGLAPALAPALGPRPARPDLEGLLVPPSPQTPGPYQVCAPRLVPAYFRKLTTGLCGACRVTVLPQPSPKCSRAAQNVNGLALTPAARQHRRLTLPQQFADRLPRQSRPIEIAHPQHVPRALLRRILGLAVNSTA